MCCQKIDKDSGVSQQIVKAGDNGLLSRIFFSRLVEKKRNFLSFIISNYVSEWPNFKEHGAYWFSYQLYYT